jgi:hypothetical protein
MSERRHELNNASGKTILFLSCLALLTVLTGYIQPPQSDEGAAAHIFQITIVLLVPAILLYVTTADWGRPLRGAQPLAIPAVALVLAFGALYYLEHYYTGAWLRSW